MNALFGDEEEGSEEKHAIVNATIFGQPSLTGSAPPLGTAPAPFNKLETAKKTSKGNVSGHKNQHYVPLSYQKAWIDPKSIEQDKITPYVWLFDKNEGVGRSKSPKGILAANDMYTYMDQHGERGLEFEHWLGALEGKFISVRDNEMSTLTLCLDTQDILPSESLLVLMLFAAVMHSRTPFQKERWQTYVDKVIEHGNKLERAFKNATPEQIANAKKFSLPSDSPSLSMEDMKNMRQQPMPSLLISSATEIAPQLSLMKKAILITNDPVGFVTTDNPCVWWAPAVGNTAHFGPCLINPDIEISMPITPRICLLLSWSGRDQGYIQIDKEHLNAINQRHIFNCHKWFISNQGERLPEWESDDANLAK